jgi:hypothetical protein
MRHMSSTCDNFGDQYKVAFNNMKSKRATYLPLLKVCSTTMPPSSLLVPSVLIANWPFLFIFHVHPSSDLFNELRHIANVTAYDQVRRNWSIVLENLRSCTVSVCALPSCCSWKSLPSCVKQLLSPCLVLSNNFKLIFISHLLPYIINYFPFWFLLFSVFSCRVCDGLSVLFHFKCNIRLT